METIRIPVRYSEQLSLISKDKRLWIYDSLMELAKGNNIIKETTMEHTILELIWRDCLLMAKKNPKFKTDAVGIIDAGIPNHISIVTRTQKGKEGKGREVKRTEQKTVCASKIPVVSPTTEESFVWVVENTPSLVGMKDPLNEETTDWFVKNYPEDVWKEVFEAMENYPNVKKKYKSAKSTAIAWLKRRGWLSYERMMNATMYEAKEVLCPRAMQIFQNKRPDILNQI